MFNTDLPLIQSPMAGVQGSELAIAVCRAGGLGSLPCAMLSLEKMRSELDAITAATDAPYNVNFFCHRNAAPDPAAEAAWQARLAPYYRELGIEPASIPAAASRSPFSSEAADILQDYKPPVVSFHFGLPEPALLSQVKAMGGMVISSATTVAEGLLLQEQGVDAVIAQGLEAGGHRGMFLGEDLTTQVGTLALLPQLVAALNIPVIAAGGIADRHGVRAAMSLGASAVQAGTAFLLCDETQTSAIHRKALTSDSAGHTALTNLFSGRPARSIMNRVMREQGPLLDQLPPFPGAGAALAPLKSAAEAAGSGDFSSLWAGQNTSGCRVAPAAAVIEELAAGFS
jgi:nitronate monooxygenase